METYKLTTKFGQLNVRVRKPILNPDGSTRTGKLSAYVIAPGQDYSGEPNKIKRACKQLFTPAVIKKYKADEAAISVDPFVLPDPLVDGETDIIDIIIHEDDHVQICKCTEIIENGERYEQRFAPVMVAPGVPVTNAPKIVTDMLKAAHPKPVVDKYVAEQEYEAAKLNIENALNNKKTADSRLLIAEEELAKPEQTQQMQELRDKLLTEKSTADAQLAKAKKAKPALKAKRDKARKAYKKFEAE